MIVLLNINNHYDGIVLSPNKNQSWTIITSNKTK